MFGLASQVHDQSSSEIKSYNLDIGQLLDKERLAWAGRVSRMFLALVCLVLSTSVSI